MVLKLVPEALDLRKLTRISLVNFCERFEASFVASLVGFEPTTPCLEGRCSILLSYRDKALLHDKRWRGLNQAALVGSFRAHLLYTVIDIDANKNDDCHGNGDVEGTHHLSNSIPVFPQNVTTVDQTRRPGEGAKEGVEHEFSLLHPGYPCREADKSTHHWQQPGEKCYSVSIFIEPAVGTLNIVVRNEDVFPPAVKEGAATPGPNPVGNQRADDVSHSTAESGQDEISRP